MKKWRSETTLLKIKHTLILKPGFILLNLVSLFTAWSSYLETDKKNMVIL